MNRGTVLQDTRSHPAYAPPESEPREKASGVADEAARRRRDGRVPQAAAAQAACAGACAAASR